MNLTPKDSGSRFGGRVTQHVALAVALAVVGGLIAFIVGASLGTRYSSTGRVLVRPPLTAQMVVTGNPGAAEDIQRVVDTDVDIAQSRNYLSLVAQRVNNPAVGTDTLVHDLAVTAPSGTDVLVFTAAEPDSQTAEAVASNAVDVFVTYLNSLSGDVTAVTSTDPNVQAALQRLKVLQQLVPPATIIERASAPTQTLPNHSRDLLVGITAGLVVALIVIALRESVRRSPSR
jgi:capsular polysaccharide biosynthesis protein